MKSENDSCTLMENIKEILNVTAHRQYSLPERPWKQYQQWHQNLFLHWQFDPAAIAALLPEGLKIDTINGKGWMSMVAFSVRKLRPRFLPAFPPISNFHEVNLRTYVIRDGIPGIYFLSIEAQKLLPALLARAFIGLPYIKSEINRSGNIYCSKNRKLMLELKAEYDPLPGIVPASGLDYWLTERHALYQENGSKLYRIDIQHKPWPLQQMNADVKNTGYPLIDSSFIRAPDLMHYAHELTVLVWGRKKV
jgi:uncharacterized protein YqjF (DUF2071 family)